MMTGGAAGSPSPRSPSGASGRRIVGQTVPGDDRDLVEELERLSLRAWRERCRRLCVEGSTLVETSLGPLEVGEEGGGPPLIVLHGLGGGWDHGLWLARRLGLHRRNRIIAVSRPGYLRTPLATGPTPDDQADALRDLLSALDLPRAAVLGSSAGALATVRFAVRHPDRCSGVVVLSGVAHRIRGAGLAARLRLVPGGDLTSWGFSSRRLHRLFAPLFWRPLTRDPRRLGRLRGSAEARRAYVEMLATGAPASLRVEGRFADLAAVATFPRRPDGAAQVPGLVIHGLRDPMVPISHARSALDWLPGARLVTVRDAGHLLPLTHPHLGRVITRFLGPLGAG
jgi:2-hydroxy-6-oxonona-2,4-dienedioate hydrolase